MTATKPHEETWRVDDECIWEANTYHGSIFKPGDECTVAHAALAAAAPELVRALLDVEWFATDGTCGRCPWCGGYESYMGYGHHGHTPDCDRQAALRKAGVLE